MPIPAPRIPLIAAASLIALSGSAFAANQIIDDTLPVEFVTISIHMPDGRIIETVERRFPSRSRVHLKTGVIPAFTPVAQSPSDSGTPESIVTELSRDEYDEIDALNQGTIEASPEPDLYSESSGDTQPDQSDQGEPESSGPARTYKKTVKH